MEERVPAAQTHTTKSAGKQQRMSNECVDFVTDTVGPVAVSGYPCQDVFSDLSQEADLWYQGRCESCKKVISNGYLRRTEVIKAALTHAQEAHGWTPPKSAGKQ